MEREKEAENERRRTKSKEKLFQSLVDGVSLALVQQLLKRFTQSNNPAVLSVASLTPKF